MICLLAFFPQFGNATQFKSSYKITLRVERIDSAPSPCEQVYAEYGIDSKNPGSSGTLGCNNVEVGDKWTGTFWLPLDPKTITGNYFTSAMALDLRTAGIHWSLSSCTEFPCMEGVNQYGEFGFSLSNGHISGISGSLQIGDPPFIDFYDLNSPNFFGQNPFSEYGPNAFHLMDRMSMSVVGSVQIHKIPLPSSGILSLLALGCLALLRGKQILY